MNRQTALFATLCVVAGMALGPVAVQAAGSLVEISSPNDRKAFVTAANQLQTAEATPKNVVHGWKSLASAATCARVLGPPAGKALMLKTLTVSVTQNPSPGDTEYAAFYVGTECARYLTHHVPAQTGIETINFEPGVPIPDGEALWMLVGGDVAAYATAVGYLVPRGAVSASSAEPSSAGAPLPGQP